MAVPCWQGNERLARQIRAAQMKLAVERKGVSAPSLAGACACVWEPPRAYHSVLAWLPWWPQRMLHAEQLDVMEAVGAEQEKQSELSEQIADLKLQIARSRALQSCVSAQARAVAAACADCNVWPSSHQCLWSLTLTSNSTPQVSLASLMSRSKT